MLSGALTRDSERWRPRFEALAGSSTGKAEIYADGPLVVVAGSGATASAGEVTCLFEGRISPPSGHPASREPRPSTAAHLALRTYRQTGAAGLAAAPGQFSAVIWNRERRLVTLVCDHLTRQGWYVLQASGAILFATELRDLLRVAQSRPGPDPLAFTMWLGGQGCPEGRTLYEGISRLSPGEIFECEAGLVTRRVIWQPRYVGTIKADRSELAAELRNRLRTAVWQYLDPGINGVILSGGIDSSVVAAVAAEGRTDDVSVRAYSAVFPGAQYDESGKVRALVEALGIRARAIEPTPVGALWLALRHLQEWGLPLIAPGAMLEMSVASVAAADGASVVLDGQTGDEVLGFAPFLVADRLAQGRVFAAHRLLKRWPADRALTSRERMRLLRRFGLKGIAPYRLGKFVRDHRDRTGHGPKWLVAGRRQIFIEFEDAWAWKGRGSGPRWWRAMTDTMIWAPHRELRLEYLRHRATTAGLRSGSPLYDADLIDFCSRVPPEIGFDPEFNRPLTRAALADLLPDEVRLQTHKADFTAFAAQGLMADAAGFGELLSHGRAEIGTFVDLAWIGHRWRSGTNPPDPASPFWGALWRAAVGEAWLRFGSDPDGLSDMLANRRIAQPSAANARIAAH